jgi:hypothetical protein
MQRNIFKSPARIRIRTRDDENFSPSDFNARQSFEKPTTLRSTFRTSSAMRSGGGRGRIRTSVARKERQIYSLLVLATHPPVRTGESQLNFCGLHASLAAFTIKVKPAPEKATVLQRKEETQFRPLRDAETRLPKINGNHPLTQKFFGRAGGGI